MRQSGSLALPGDALLIREPRPEYLLRGRLMGPLSALDRACYRRRWLMKYSYRQFVMLSEPQ